MPRPLHEPPFAVRAQEAEDLLDYEAEEDAGAAAAKPAAGSAAAAGAAKEKKCGKAACSRPLLSTPCCISTSPLPPPPPPALPLLRRGHFVGVHSSSFRDFMLKPELLRCVVVCGRRGVRRAPAPGRASCPRRRRAAPAHARSPAALAAQVHRRLWV